MKKNVKPPGNTEQQYGSDDLSSESGVGFRSLFETMLQGVIYYNEDGAITLANPAAESILGLSLDQMLGKTVTHPQWKVIHEDGTDFACDHYPSTIALSTGRNVSDTIMGICNPDDGEYRWIEVCAVPQFLNSATSPYQVCVTFTDISERKKAEVELTMFKSVFDHSNEACAISDPSGRLIYINKAHEILFGRSLEEAQSLNYRDYYPPESIVILDELVAPLIERGESWEGELDVFDASGRRFPLWERADAIRDSCRRLLYGFGFMHDVTERRQMEETLARAAERDRNIANVLQKIVMPTQIPILPAGFEMAAKYRPASNEADVCGDFCDIFDLGEGNIGISIGDIVGKGLVAALRITSVRNMIRNYAYLYAQPSKVMALVNEALCRDISTENDMLTAFFAILDTKNGILKYSNAGHEPPIIRRSDGQVLPLRMGGPMFCGMEQQVYLEGIHTLQADDVFVTVTDGISEASIDRRAEQFGLEGIICCLSKNAVASAACIATAILDDATRFANGTLHDDASIVVIKTDGNYNR